MEFSELSPELRENLKNNAQTLLQDQAAMEELHVKTGYSLQEIVEMCKEVIKENVKNPSFWIGIGLASAAAAVGFFKITMKVVDNTRNQS
ncbi:MAG: hypothetical protein IKO65_04315 [Victivallales bacterium]|nr:hypothetical protein [Victivallales bacterium]